MVQGASDPNRDRDGNEKVESVSNCCIIHNFSWFGFYLGSDDTCVIGTFE